MNSCSLFAWHDGLEIKIILCDDDGGRFGVSNPSASKIGIHPELLLSLKFTAITELYYCLQVIPAPRKYCGVSQACDNLRKSLIIRSSCHLEKELSTT